MDDTDKTGSPVMRRAMESALDRGEGEMDDTDGTGERCVLEVKEKWMIQVRYEGECCSCRGLLLQ
jgi:hypothetical protein